jgi:microcystin-dependent protein
MVWRWSKTASNNATADSTINWAEGQAPSSINDSARAEMARVAQWRDDIAGAILTTGTSSAYAVSSNQVFDTLAHMDGGLIAFTPHTGNASPCTLNVDALGAKPLRLSPGVEVPAATLVQGTPYVALYNNANAEFYLRGFYNLPYAVPLGGMMPYLAGSPPNSNFVLPYGQAISRATYSALFALVGTTYGTGDGSTTFNIPDIRGRVPVGPDTMGGVAAGRVTSAASGVDGTTIGAVGGTQTKTLQRSDLPNTSVSVTATDSGHVHPNNVGIGVGTVNVAVGNGGPNVIQSDVASHPTTTGTANITASFNLNGGVTQTLVNGMQPSIIIPYILRVI